MDKIGELTEEFMNILNISFFREQTLLWLVHDISNEITNRSIDVISNFMQLLSAIEESDDSIDDYGTDSDEIFVNMLDTLIRRTVPFTIASIRTSSVRLMVENANFYTRARAKDLLARIWYKRLVSM